VIISITQPHQGLSLFSSSCHSTPTVSFRHRPSTTPSNEPDFGSLGPALRGNKLIPLEYQLRGCCYQIFEIMVYTTQNLQIAFHKKLINQEKEFLCVSFCVPFLHKNYASYCFKIIITQHVVPAAGTHINLTALFLCDILNIRAD
jgi:hypothetical protein